MKCPFCNKGTMEVIKDIMEQDSIEFEAYRCPHCREEVMDMQQLKSLATKYRKLKKAKEVTFAKWGNSIAVRIPHEIVSEYRITSGKQGIITKEKEGIKIIPA